MEILDSWHQEAQLHYNTNTPLYNKRTKHSIISLLQKLF